MRLLGYVAVDFGCYCGIVFVLVQTYKPKRFQERLDYSFAVGRVRAQEQLLFDRAQYERLIRAQASKGFLGALAETRYSQFIDEESRTNPALIFARAGEENLRFCLKYAAEEWLELLLRLPAEIYNLKIGLKQALSEDAGLALRWQLPEMSRGLARGKQWYKVKALISEGGADALYRARERSDPALIDILLDRLEQRLALNLSTGQDYAFGYYQLFADLNNLLIALRLRFLDEDEGVLAETLLPGGILPAKTVFALIKADDETIEHLFGSTIFAQIMSTGWKSAREKSSLVPMEKKVRESLLEYVNSARYVALGYEPLLRFYRLWENELTNLRLLYAAKVAGLGSEECQELVVYGF